MNVIIHANKIIISLLTYSIQIAILQVESKLKKLLKTISTMSSSQSHNLLKS